jgi:hypothetical protein
MKYYFLSCLILLSIVTMGQVKKIPISQVKTWQRPTKATSFTSQQGGRFSLSKSLKSQQQGYQKSLYAFKIFPNPSDGFVKLKGAVLPSFISVYNAQGVRVDKIKVKLLDAQNAEFEMNSLPSGLYILQSDGFVSQRLKLN